MGVILRFVLVLFNCILLNYSYAQVDSLPIKKWFLKANGSIVLPFDGNSFNMAFNSISVLRLTKRLNMHEFGLNSVKLETIKRDLNSYKYTYLNIDLTYQYNYVFLKKRKIKPYLGINNDFLVYYEYTTSNSGYERRFSTLGIEDRVRLMIGALYLYKNRILFDMSIVPLIGCVFETGYRVQYYADPALPIDSRTVKGIYFNYNQIHINRFADIFNNAVSLRLGVGILI